MTDPQLQLLPGADGIVDDLLLVCSLAQKTYVDPENLSRLPYLQHAITDRSGRIFIERLLSAAIRLRFLDDQSGVLSERDRRLESIGSYFEGGERRWGQVCIRHALNKLIHHDVFKIRAENSGAIIVALSEPATTEARQFDRTGVHRDKRVFISVEGTYGKPWRLDLDLYALANEVLRVFDPTQFPDTIGAEPDAQKGTAES